MFNRIQCDAGKLIYITHAAYGRTDGTTCPKNGGMSDQTCEADRDKTLQTVKDK